MTDEELMEAVSSVLHPAFPFMGIPDNKERASRLLAKIKPEIERALLMRLSEWSGAICVEDGIASKWAQDIALFADDVLGIDLRTDWEKGDHRDVDNCPPPEDRDQDNGC